MDPSTQGAVRSTYDRIADSYAAARRTPYPEVLRFLDELPAQARILDLGCGHGRHAGPALDRDHPLVGVDISRGLLIRAKRALPVGAWLMGSCTSIPLAAGSVDACLCIAVLHHLPTSEQRATALREIRRVLRPGGRLLASVWDQDQPRFRNAGSSDVIVPWPLPDRTKVPRFYHLFGDGELESLVIASGLHGERFFRARGNRFAEATSHG